IYGDVLLDRRRAVRLRTRPLLGRGPRGRRHLQLVDGAVEESGRPDSGPRGDKLCPERVRNRGGKMGILAMNMERIRPAAAAGAKVAFFDFDGTLSLVRSGWMDVMVPMMVEILLDLKTGEPEAQLRAVVEDFVWRLTGKQTMYQMVAFADEISKRGGAPLDPLEYKTMYLDRLHVRIR